MSSILQSLHNFVHHEHGESVVLLVKVKLFDGTDEEEHVTVKESQVGEVCARFAGASDAKEVWVYRQFYHSTQMKDSNLTDAAVFAGAALGRNL